ncbi:valine--tRNA ligase [Mycoplasmoides genitalium]|uniref:valine--tRNA ligase n=1 Tax=Mycoplasmoides genitalium TaxID=2097 RepID=UPI00027B3D33|nr:valine--tRNA ligase [Mycoplasmoides genitalium]AFQ03171.1 valyl-tRNA synthetase [Mycoplasmoides genitalium M2321]AFQ04665.1 valyl-tRNA synthetase [Mycoplasmoides genitalium M2288]
MKDKFSFQKNYDFNLVSDGLYEIWNNAGFFKPKDKNNSFTAILPPPNLTGTLHIGHAFEVSITDQIMRFKKMQGFSINWIPGFDHAGIATQTKYEKIALKENQKYFDADDDKKSEMIMNWALNQSEIIKNQLKSLGVCLNWSETKFTLSEQANKIVNNCFKNLYENGFIYQAYTLVNWDTKLNTAISNIEVINKPVNQHLHYVVYKLANDSKQELIVATTRPETIFADVCLLVNPKDKRYTNFWNKLVVNPLTGKQILVVTDSYVDIKFGTGILKCTPAHDFNDYEINTKYKFDFLSCIDSNGILNQNASKFQGLSVLQARNKIVKWLEKNKLLVKSIPLTSNVGFSERSGTVVEPMLSKQWFVDLPKLKDHLYLKKYPDFIPKRFNKQVSNWLNKLKPWCISRQLIWGHKIPVWFENNTGEIVVGEKPSKNLQNYTRSKDVLDTWFSSSLWPLICLNWEQDDSFHETELLVTGYDILFFWVLRMLFNSFFETKKLPFKTVLIHGLVRDEQNRKMSKSLNNGIDPVDLIRNYGADAVRLFLCSNHTPGDDLIFSEQKIKSAWNFLNKLWNVTKFVIQLENDQEISYDLDKLSLSETWILAKLDKVIQKITKLLDKFQLALANQILVKFVWDDFCNTFIEAIKKEPNQLKPQLFYTAKSVLSNIAILLSITVPFLSERIYQQFNNKSVMQATWPLATKIKIPKLFDLVLAAINDLRNYRKQYMLNSQQKLVVILSGKNAVDVKQYFNFSWIELKIETNKKVSFKYQIVDDTTQRLKSLQKQQAFFESEVKRSQAIVKNKSFLEKAPKEKVKSEFLKLEEYQKKLTETNQLIAKLTKAH